MKAVVLQASTGRRFWRSVRSLVASLIPYGFWDYSPRVDAEIVVFRLDNDAVMLQYPYKDAELASWHLQSIRGHLRSQNVFDFCRDRGIAINDVCGAGYPMSESADPPIWEYRDPPVGTH
ncbi:hypothetical protein [Nocardioides carbamazepini]|uniref:hypothetical protein n=1 Tax=Nocardioides carbamazepini TaxID=2854259 RepID=UPI002149A56D|nr:hypothetical protein [Nocardioides carbamazepini]